MVPPFLPFSLHYRSINGEIDNVLLCFSSTISHIIVGHNMSYSYLHKFKCKGIVFGSFAGHGIGSSPCNFVCKRLGNSQTWCPQCSLAPPCWEFMVGSGSSICVAGCSVRKLRYTADSICCLIEKQQNITCGLSPCSLQMLGLVRVF